MEILELVECYNSYKIKIYNVRSVSNSKLVYQDFNIWHYVSERKKIEADLRYQLVYVCQSDW